MLFGCQRSMCTEHGLGLDNAPEVLRCLVVEAVQVDNLAFAVVDVARWVSGCSRLSTDNCGEYARKLSMEGTFSLVTGLPPLVCKSIAKASKVRILHLPPRAREGL
jgi:hypothetical protein